MSVLITGGSGLIGSTLARMLAERGESVTVFDRVIVPGRFQGLEDRVRTIRGELGIFSHVLDAVSQARPRTIYHLGAMLSIPANEDPPGAFAANVQGTFHVLEAARPLGQGAPQGSCTARVPLGGLRFGVDTAPRGHSRGQHPADRGARLLC